MYDASPPLLGQMAFVKQNGTVSESLDRAWMHAGAGGGGVHRLWFLSSQGVGGWRRSQLSPWRNKETGALPISHSTQAVVSGLIRVLSPSGTSACRGERKKSGLSIPDASP